MKLKLFYARRVANYCIAVAIGVAVIVIALEMLFPSSPPLIRGVTISERGDTVAIAGFDRTIRFGRGSSNLTVIEVFERSSTTVALDVGVDDFEVALACADSMVFSAVNQLKKNREGWRPGKGPWEFASAVAEAPTDLEATRTGKMLAFATRGEYGVFDVSEQELLWQEEIRNSPLLDCEIWGDNGLVIYKPNEIILLDLRTRLLRNTVPVSSRDIPFRFRHDVRTNVIACDFANKLLALHLQQEDGRHAIRVFKFANNFKASFDYSAKSAHLRGFSFLSESRLVAIDGSEFVLIDSDTGAVLHRQPVFPQENSTEDRGRIYSQLFAGSSGKVVVCKPEISSTADVWFYEADRLHPQFRIRWGRKPTLEPF
ncbi:hypothetical protein [Stratiformator vulcanicus]|nr:hypothetical protein [Stratiformator vulcanicus]